MSVKCDNCTNPASYTHADPGASAVNYCATCLPSWLQDRANSGHFPLVSKIEDAVEAVVEKIESKVSPKRKKDKPSAEDVVAEAPAEEAPAPAEEAPANEDN